MFHLACRGVLILALLSTTALAQTSKESPRVACQYDMINLCPGISGTAAIVSCLKSQKERVSERCWKAMEAKEKADPWSSMRRPGR
jgi:hypothetical protein